MPKLLHWIVSVFAENWILKIGGVVVGIASSLLLYFFATDGGVSWWISILFAALVLYTFTSAGFFVSSVFKRRAKPSDTVPTPSQQLTQTGVSVTNSPTFAPQFIVGQIQNQPPVQAQQAESQPPRVDPLPATIENVSLDTATGEVTNSDSSIYQGFELRKEDVAFAKFHRDVDGSSEPFVDVRGYLEFFTSGGKPIYRVDHALWWRHQGTFASFRPGDTEKLIVAIVDEAGVTPYSGEYEDKGGFAIHPIKIFKPEFKHIQGEEFLVRIVLIGTRGSISKLKHSFDYDLKRAPNPAFTLRERADPARLVERLREFQNEGSDILKRLEAHHVLVPYQSQAEVWAANVEQFLLANDKKDYALRFKSSLTDYQYDREATGATRNLVDWLYTRVMRLKEFTKELGGA